MDDKPLPYPSPATFQPFASIGKAGDVPAKASGPRFLPMQQFRIMIADILVAANACPYCVGSSVCPSCNGTRRTTPKGGSGTSQCPDCTGSGRCAKCVDHVGMLESFAQELQTGSPGSAEACLQRAMINVGQSEQRARSNAGIGAAGFGALIGTMVAPGLGTIVGMSLGKMLGDSVDPSEPWKQADVFYSLGILYALTGRKAEANQAWIKALTLNEHHDAARAELKASL